MRIVGGILSGRTLLSPEGDSTRPTSDRAREAIFNVLAHASWRAGEALDGAKAMDVFAGTGALGLEALSRGAKHCVFIENDRKALRICTQNVEKMHMEEQSKLIAADALAPPARPAHIDPRNLVLLDPPYGKGLGAAALEALAQRGWLAEGALCVLEMDKKRREPQPKGFAPVDERAYGIALIRFLRWQGGSG